MSAIHQYGHIWKDREGGVWVTHIELFDRVVTVTAIEVAYDGYGWAPVTAEVHEWVRFTESRGHNLSNIEPMRLGDMDCVVYFDW